MARYRFGRCGLKLVGTDLLSIVVRRCLQWTQQRLVVSGHSTPPHPLPLDGTLTYIPSCCKDSKTSIVWCPHLQFPTRLLSRQGDVPLNQRSVASYPIRQRAHDATAPSLTQPASRPSHFQRQTGGNRRCLKRRCSSPRCSHSLLDIAHKLSTRAAGLFFLRCVGQAQDVPCEGSVVAAGPGRTHPLTGTLIPMCVSEGDTVLFSRFSGRKVREENIVVKALSLTGRGKLLLRYFHEAFIQH